MANFSIIAKLGLDDTKFGRGLKGVKSKAGGIGSKIGTAIKAGFAVAVAAAVAFAAKSVVAFAKFETKINEVRTLLPKMTEGGFDKMQKDVRDLASTMGVDLMDATQALYNAISAGIPEDNAIDFLKDATKLSIGGVTDLNTAVEGLSTILNGYNLEATEAGRISDIMFATMQGGMTTIAELSQNVGKVTPLASELGVSFEEVGAMFATLTKKLGAGKTAEAGTQIKQMLAELGKEGTKAADAFERLSGQSFQEFIKSGGSVGEALQMMSKEAERNGTGLQNMFGSIEAGMGALALAANDGRNLADSLQGIREGAGGTQKAFDTMNETMGRNWDKLKAKGTEVMMKVGEAFMPLVNRLLPLFTGFIEALPALFGETAGAGEVLTAMFDMIVGAVKFTIKIIATIINSWGSFADILVYVGKQIAVFVNVFIGMGKAAFSPIVAVIMGVIEAFKALGTILSNPFDPAAYKKAWDGIKNAGGNIVDSVKNWGGAFSKEWDKNTKHFAKNNKEFIGNMRKRGDTLKDIWAEEGKFAFLAAKAGEAGAKDLGNAMGDAAGKAVIMSNAIGTIPWNIRTASTNITRHLVRALARGLDAANPLAEKMKEIQERSKEIAAFWKNAADNFGKVAQGKVVLQVAGWKDVDLLNNQIGKVVRNMGQHEAALRGGANRIAALAPEAMKAVMDAFEASGRKDAAVLQTMYENAQRAQDMTIEGLAKLDDEIDAITEAARQADTPLQALNASTRQYLEWLQARRDIAEENLQIQLQNIAGQQDLMNQMDELGSLLGMITDLQGRKDAESQRLLKLHMDEYEKVTRRVKEAVDNVAEEAAKIGINPDQVEAVKNARALLQDVEDNKLSEAEQLGEIAGILRRIEELVKGISDAVRDIDPNEKDKEAKKWYDKLNQQETQEEVLDRLGGFFVNQ